MAVVRYREENGKISRKCGNTLIQTLRETYGPAFAPGCADYAKLSDVLAKLDELSLGHLIRDYEAGKLLLDGAVSAYAPEPFLFDCAWAACRACLVALD